LILRQCVTIRLSCFRFIDFETKLFNSPNGANDNNNDYPIRLVLSSYYWQGSSVGVPDGLSTCDKCTLSCSSCRTTEYWAAYSEASCGYDATYTRPHRDLDIVNSMRNWLHLGAKSHADLGLNC
jgi:alpha-amylase